jgi:ketose-bisphosphate aldolase
MTVVNLNQLLKKAAVEGYAVGAFNIINYLTTRAVIAAAEELQAPLIIQTSTATVKYYGVKPLINFLAPLSADAKVPVAIHLDHCTDPVLAKECIAAGWSSVMFDGSQLPLDQNIATTLEIVNYAHPRGVTVEGELGTIVGVEEEIVVENGNQSLVNVDEALKFMKESHIDAFAPAIGTAHGLYKGKPQLNFELFANIKAIALCPLVIHGGTGLTPDIFQKLVLSGAAKINISTAIKVAYFSGIEDYVKQSGKRLEPLQLDRHIDEMVQKVVKEHIRLFGAENRI